MFSAGRVERVKVIFTTLVTAGATLEIEALCTAVSCDSSIEAFWVENAVVKYAGDLVILPVDDL